jgi:hypothetical protein
MHALTVPSSYSNNVLTIGSNSYTLASQTGGVYTASTGISINSGSIITNTAPDVPVTFTSSSSNIGINGSYPNFGISYSSTPVQTSLTLNGNNNNNLSAGTNTVVLNTYTAGTGITMLGGPNYTITSSASNPTINGVGVAIVSPTTGNNFIVSVPNPSIAVSGNSLITLSQGTAISTASINPPLLALTGANNNSLSAGSNTVTLNTYTAGSGITLSGGPNYTITSSASNPTINAAGIAVVSPTTGNNFTVTVPNPSIAVSGNSLLTLSQGTSVSTATLNPPILALLGTNNNSLSAGSNTVTLNTYTSGSGITITGGPNYTIASSASSPTINGAGVAVISPTTGSNFVVTVPNPSISASNTLLTLTQGTSTSTTTINNYTVGSGLSMSGGPNFTISSSAANPTVNGAGVAQVSPTTGANFVVTVPAPSVTVAGTLLTLTQGTAVSTATLIPPLLSLTGVANNNLSAGNNTIVLNTYTTGSGLSITGGPNYTISSSASNPTISGSGLATVTPTSGLTFAVNVPNPTLTSTGNTVTLTQGTLVTSASIPETSITSSGIASISTAGTNSFIVSVPSPTYNAINGALNTGTATTNITALLSFTNNILTSGPASNSVIIPASVSTSIFPAGSATVLGAFPSFTVSTPASPTITGSGLAIVSASTGANFTVTVPALTFTPSTGALASGTNVVNITSPLSISGNTLTSGASSNSVDISSISPFTTSGASIYQTTLTNSLGIGTNAPLAKLDVEETALFSGTHFKVQNINPSNTSNMVDFTSLSAGTALNVFSNNSSTASVAGLFDGGLISKGKTNTNSGYAFRALNALSSDLFVVRNDGFVGVGVSSPTAMLTVSNTSTGQTGYFVLNNSTGPGHALVTNSNSDNQSTFRSLSTSTSLSTYAGIFEGGLIGVGKNDPNSFALVARNYSGPDLFVVRNDGNVGIGTSNPSALFQVINTSLFDAIAADVTNVTNVGNALQIRHFGLGNAGYFEVNNTSGAFAIQAVSNSGTQNTIKALSSNANLGIYAGYFDGGLVTKGKNALNTAYAFRAQNSGSSDLLAVLNDGYVGIGTSNPATKLHIHSSTSNFVQARFTHTATSTFGLVISTDNLSAAFLNYDNTPLYFGTNGANRMVISSTGNVGIGPGAITPAAKLDVSGTMKFADGTEGTGKVLTSDASGNATWQNTGVPSGAIMAFGGSTIPAGWVICDGAAISRTGTNASLFAAIGTAWGAGNGTTTFNVPDMRGMFLRGVASGSANDPDRAGRTASNTGGNTGDNVGTRQTDEFEIHNHTISNLGSTTLGGLGLGTVYTQSGTTTSNSTGGSTETRPKNVYVYYIIKL